LAHFSTPVAFKPPAFESNRFLKSKTNLVNIDGGPMISPNLVQFGHAALWNVRV